MLAYETLACELGWLRRLAARYCPSAADAEDLYGETVCRIAENRARFAEGMPFRPWAKTVMENIFISGYNRRRLAPMRPLGECGDPKSLCRADTRAEVRDLLSAIRRLAKASVCVEAVRLYALCGLTYEEVGRKMGIGVEVVKTRIATGRKMIRKALRLDKF